MREREQASFPVKYDIAFRSPEELKYRLFSLDGLFVAWESKFCGTETQLEKVQLIRENFEKFGSISKNLSDSWLLGIKL